MLLVVNDTIFLLLSGAGFITFPGTENAMSVGLSAHEELAECLTGGMLQGGQGNGIGKPQEVHMDALRSVAVPHMKNVVARPMKCAAVPHMKSVAAPHMVNLLTSAHQNEVGHRFRGLRSAVDLLMAEGMYGRNLQMMKGKMDLKEFAVQVVLRRAGEECMKSGNLKGL